MIQELTYLDTKYLCVTLQPNQRGTAEEIQDYIRECDCLHSLTVLTPFLWGIHSEVSQCFRDNWRSYPQALGMGCVCGLCVRLSVSQSIYLSIYDYVSVCQSVHLLMY